MKPTQYFSHEYLEQCRHATADDILRFLDNFRKLQQPTTKKSKLISMKVPDALLESFRAKCGIDNVKYQTQIKKLMQEWLCKT